MNPSPAITICRHRRPVDTATEAIDLILQRPLPRRCVSNGFRMGPATEVVLQWL